MQGGMCTNPLDARNLLLSSQLLDAREKTVSALDAIAVVTPVMVEAGIHAFRRWKKGSIILMRHIRFAIRSCARL